MANNLHFEYSLSVNEKQTQQNLATFIKKTFGTDKNAKLSVPIKLDITTNLTNVDLKTIQDQLDKQFKGKLTLNATVKIDSSNVARQAQAELDRISKSLSLKVGLEVDPSAMKLMLGTVDVIKTLNAEVTKVKDNLKDLSKKIEINISGVQVNGVFDKVLNTAEQIQKVNTQTTEEINEQLGLMKEQLANQKKLAEQKRKELDAEKEKQVLNKKIEESNRRISAQQQEAEKELKNIEKQIKTETKKMELLDKQNKTMKSTAKAQEEATERIEKSTKKISELEKQRADNQAYLQSKREEEKQLLTNIELGKQEISLLQQKIKEMKNLTKATTQVSTSTSTKKAGSKPSTKKTSNKKVVQVDSPAVQASVNATIATEARVEAENNVTKAIDKQTQVQADSVNKQIQAQNKLADNAEATAKRVANSSYRAEDSVRQLRMPKSRDKLYNNIAGSEFASSINGLRIHDISSKEEQVKYEEAVFDTLVKSRGVLTDFNLELKEGVALTEEQVELIKERIKLIQQEMVDTKELAGSKDKADRQPFNKALKKYLEDPTNETLGSELDFQAEKVSKIGAMYKYLTALTEERNKLEGMLGTKIKENAEVEAKRLELEAKRANVATNRKTKTAENQSNRALNKNLYKDAGDFLKEEVYGFDVDELDDAFEEYYEELAEQSETIELMGKKFNFAKQGKVNYEELNKYFDLMAKQTEKWKSEMASASDADAKKIQDNIEYAEEDVKYLKMLANSITKVNALANTKSLEFEMEDEADDLEEVTEAMEDMADPKLVAKIKNQAENFDYFIGKTHALNEQTHQVKGGVLAVLAHFDKLNRETSTSAEEWDKLSQNLSKYRDMLGITQEEIDEYVVSSKEREKEEEQVQIQVKTAISQGREYIKQLREQMQTMDRESEAWERRNKAINVFNQLVKDKAGKAKIDEKVLELQDLLYSSKEKDSGDFKESNNNIKIIRNQAKAGQDVTVQYEKQAQALSKIINLQKKGENVSLNIDKLIDSQGRGWREIAEEQEKAYRRMKDNMLWFQVQHLDADKAYFGDGEDGLSLFEPAKYMDFSKDASDRESMIKFISEYTAKVHLLTELGEKMQNYTIPPTAKKADLDIVDKTTKAKIEEAEAMDAITAKQKEQQKNEKIHQKWLAEQEKAKLKEPYLKASKELLKRMKSSNEYKKNKEDDSFVQSFENTKQYIEALKHSSFSIENVVDAFEQLKTYAHETFHMKNETIQKLVEPFVGIENAVTQTSQEIKKVESNTKEVANEAERANKATQDKAQTEVEVAQQVEKQANAQKEAKKDAEATAEATEKQVKAQKEMSAELRKQIILATSDELIEQLPTKLLNKMYEGIGKAIDRGIKLTKTKLKDIISVVDAGDELSYSQTLGERGRLVAEGRKKKDGVIYNRTDEYKAKKAEMDKRVEELEKPLLDILKMMENELKGTVTKAKREVKKSEPTQNKTIEINKTKQEQIKITQTQAELESNMIKKQGNVLQIAREILQANKEGREYILDINSLLDEQGRSWQDIAKNSEKVYKNVTDKNILYTAFENMDMNRVYGNDEQSNGIFTPTNYIDNDRYNKAETDSERIALMSEYDGKFGVLNSLEEAFKQLLEEEDKQIQLGNSLTDIEQQRLQIAKEVVKARELDKEYLIDINSLLDEQGRSWQDIAKDNEKAHMKLQHDILYQAYENADMSRVYDMGKQGDSLATGAYVDNSKWSVKVPDAEKVRLVSEYSAKNQVLEPIRKLVHQLEMEQNDIISSVKEEVVQPKKEQEIAELEERTHQIRQANTDELEKQVTVQKQIVQAKEDSFKASEAEAEAVKKQLTEEEKKARLQKLIQQNKEDIRGEDEIQYLNEEIAKIDEKTNALKRQGETSKFLANLKMAGISNMADSISANVMANPKSASDYGIEDSAKFIKEQRELHSLLNDRVGLQMTLDQQQDLIEENKAYQLELDKLNGVVRENTKVEQENNNVAKEKADIKDRTLQQLEYQVERFQRDLNRYKSELISDEELEKLEEEVKLNRAKREELLKQGETAKFMAEVMKEAQKGEDSFGNILNSFKLQPEKHGVTNLAQYKEEQETISKLEQANSKLVLQLKEQSDYREFIEQDTEMLHKAQKELNDYLGIQTEQVEVEQKVADVVQEVAKARKEEAQATHEAIEEFKTLEEYQERYKKEPKGLTDETFDTNSNLTVYHPKFSSESIGHLESMMEMFYTKDGGVMPSYKGMALPQKVIESLGTEKLNELLSEYIIRFHKEFQKYVSDSYLRMDYARDLAGKGENVEDDHYFQKMTKAMEEFKAKLINDALKLINDISKSEDSVFVSNDKYEDLADYWLMEGGHGHDVAMSNSDISSHANDQAEILANQEKELQAALQTQKATQKIVDNKKEEAKIQKQIVGDKEADKQESKGIAQATQDVEQTVEEEAQANTDVLYQIKEVKAEVENTGAKWKETYVHLVRVVEASNEFKKANLGALDVWDEIKSSTESYELDEQWKKAVDAVKEYADEMEIVLEEEEKLYQQRQQENAKTSLTDTPVGAKQTTTNKLSDETKALIQNTIAKRNNTKATQDKAKAEQNDTNATQNNTNTTENNTKAKQKKAKATKQVSQAVQEMITIEKEASVKDYINATLEAIKKVSKSKTFKDKAVKDISLKETLGKLESEAKVNRSSGTLGIDYWQGIIQQVRDIASKAGMKGTTIDNAVIPFIGGSVPKNKASNQVKALAESGVTSAETSKIANETAKIEATVEKVANTVVEVSNVLDKVEDEIQAVAQATEDAEKAVESEQKMVEQIADKKEDEVVAIQEVAQITKEVTQAKEEEFKVENSTIDQLKEKLVGKKEEAEIQDDIVETEKEVVVIAQETAKYTQEEIDAVEEELKAKQKTLAQDKASLKIVQAEAKESEKKDKALASTINKEQKEIDKNREKLAIMRDNATVAQQEADERAKIKAEIEANIQLLREKADLQRQAIADLEAEKEDVEDNTDKVRQLTKEFEKTQEAIRESEQAIDDLMDSYNEASVRARKENNEASQKMIDDYMKRIEEEVEQYEKERAKYLPPISGEVGEYRGGDGGGNVPPSGGGDSFESSINVELNDRIKLRQRELLLQLQQITHNKDLNDEQKLGVQNLADQIVEMGRLTTSMKDLQWYTQNIRENMKEFKFSIKVDEDNTKELVKLAEEERKEITNMYAGLFDQIDAEERLKAEKVSLKEVIALYKQKTLAEFDSYGAKNVGYVDQDRLSSLRAEVTYLDQSTTNAHEYEQEVRRIGDAYKTLKFDTDQTKQWYKMEADAEKNRVAIEKEAKAQEELSKKVQDHIQVKEKQLRQYIRQVQLSGTMQKATEEEKAKLDSLLNTFKLQGNTVQEVNQNYSEMQRVVKDIKLDAMNRQLQEQETWLDKVKNGIKDYVRFTLDLDDIQGVMQNLTQVYRNSFEHIKVLDEAYTNINQTMDITQSQFQDMVDVAYEAGNANGALATEILEMQKIYAGATETAESVNSKIAGTVAFSNVSGLAGTDATNALQTILNQFQLTSTYGMEAGDAISYVGDALVGVAYSLSKDEGDAMQEIVSAVEDAGSVIAQSGGSLEWYSAIAGTLAEQMNATGSEVGGAMRMITARTLQQKEAFDEMNDTGEETEVVMANAEKALQGLGISIRNSGGDLRSIEDILGEVASKWQTMNESEQQFVAEKLAGTNRRTYFMGLMENYDRVIQLQTQAENSAGAMMEASEKKAESLEGRLNTLTNAQERFYQTILTSDTTKSAVTGLTNLLNKITDFVGYMDGKWIPALGGATGALIAFKMAKDGLTFGDFIKGLGTTILKFAGLEAGAITATGALTALKSVLLGIAGGAVLAVITGGIVALVNSMKSAEEQIEETRVALDNYKATMADVENDSASLQGMQMKVDKMKELNTTLDDQARLAREVNDELASHADSYGSIEHILRNENIALQDRLDLLDKEIEKRGEIARQAALEALNGEDMFGFGDTVYDNLVEDLDPIMGEFLNAQNGINKASLGGLFAPSTEQIDSYYELWEDAESRLQALYEQGAEQYSLAQKYFEEGIINEEDMAQQTELYEQFVDDLLLQVQRVSGETGSSIALDMFEFEDPFNPMVDPTQSLQEQNAYYVEQVALLETLKGLYNDVQDGISGTELSNIFNSDVMKNFTGDITKTEDVMAHLGQKIAETENEINALGATSHSVFNKQEKDVAELQKEYIDACKTIEDIEGYMEQIGEEGGVSADMMTTLFDSGLLEGYTGALNDAGAIQEHLTSKIAESEEVARQAYLNMMKDDADFWAQKMANSEEWRDHENTVQQDIIGIMANSLGVQAEDFSSFIDSKGGMRAVDYTNASTMAEAENTMQSSLATQVLGYAAQLINSKAGYRQTDMGNVNEFLNSQGVAEAKTVQELAAMWAEFYNAKVAAINNTMSEINSQIAAGWTNDQIAAMDGWFGDGSLRAKQTELNKLQNQIKSLAATNLTMTNFFAGLDTYFSGVGGGVGQNTVGGGKIGGGGGGNSWKPTSTGGSGSGGRGSGGSGSGGSGSGGRGSGGSGSGGSGSGSSKEEVEDMEAEIDRYYELNDAINDNEKAISQLQAKRDSITTKSAYKKSIEQEVALLNKQIQAYKNLQKEQEKERNEIKKTLSKNGFKFDSNGDIANYAKQVKKLQDQANKKTGTKKEQAIENVEYLIDLIERYNELNSDAIPDTKLEIIDLQYEITELNRDLEENMKNIEKLTDRYFGFNQAMNDLSDALDINRAKQEHADEEEKIALMQEEIELMKQQQALSKKHKSEAEKEAKELQKQLKDKGFTFDTSGNITNYKDLIEKLEKKANSLVGDAQDDAVQNIEDLLELVDKYVELSENTIPELELSWYEYANSIKDVEEEMEEMYKKHQENAVQTQKDIASAYEHYLDKRYNKLKEALNKERDLYNESYDAENFQRELSEEQRTLDEIAQQIAIYERDTSVAGQARLAQLKEEYEAQQKLINEMIRDNEHDKANDAFDDAQDALDNELEALLKPEQLVQTVNDAIASGMITIGDEVVKLDALMSAWMDETGDGLYALGDIIKGEFLENLKDAQQILTGMNILGTNGSISLASSNALLNPNARVLTSNSGTSSVSFDAPLVYINGNVDQDVMKDLEKALKEAEQNIYNQISKSLKL